jgi:hypothetical protein
MQRAIAASVRIGLGAPGAHHARAGKRLATAAGPAPGGAWNRRSKASAPAVPAALGSSRRAVRVCRAISTDAPAAAEDATSSAAANTTQGPTFQQAIQRLQDYWASKGRARAWRMSLATT